MQRIDEKSLVAAIKPELVILDTEELNAETPAHLLDDDITPLSRLFTRNTGAMPVFTAEQLAGWTLTIDGFVRRPRRWPLAALQRDFPRVTEASVIECAGNGRAFFHEPAGPVKWHHGAVGCVRWTGVRLRDLLEGCGVLPEAVYTGHHSPDRYIDDSGPAISRGVPIAKALSPETLVAYEVNGEPIPPLHGGPLRLIAPGYPGATYHKWLTRIEVRDREHDGERMTGIYYRLPRKPVRHGERYDVSDFEIITDMPVKSLITAPRDGFIVPASSPVVVRGHAWSGHSPVAKVEISADGGTSWRAADLSPTADRFAWRRFEARLHGLPTGEIEIMARATDSAGRAQPLECVAWNPLGFCNNMVHRVRGRIG